MNNRIIAIIFCVILAIMPCVAQSLTNEEIGEMMNHAFQLGKEKKYKEAVESFDIVGENTKLCRTEDERQVFVISQTMVCLYCELSNQYKKGYGLAKKLLTMKLTEDEKKEIQRLQVLNGYLYACGYLHKDNANYPLARLIFDEILPSANEDMKTRILSKVPLSWYFEGVNLLLEQQYESAIPCIEEACKGYHQIFDYKNELRCLIEIGSAKEKIYDMKGAEEAYRNGKMLAHKMGETDHSMELLSSLSKIYFSNENYEEYKNARYEMDSVATSPGCSPSIIFDYYINKGEEARSIGKLELSNQWFSKSEQLLLDLPSSKLKSAKYICYSKLRDLSIVLQEWDKALVYANRCLNEMRSSFGKGEERNFLPYYAFVEIYKHKNDSAMAHRYIDSIFVSKDFLSEPREIHMLYTIRGRFYSHFGDYSKAAADFKEADRILATKYKESDIERIKLLPYIGGAENKLENYIECERYFSEYFMKTKELYGEDSLDHIEAIQYLANAEGLAGHIAEGCKNYELYLMKIKNKIREKLPHLNSSERESFWTPISEMLTSMTPYAVEAKLFNTDFTQSCYNALVLSKAFLLESERNLFDILKSNGRDEDLRDLMSINAMQSRIRDLNKINQSNDAPINPNVVDTLILLNNKVSSLEHKLLSRCNEYGNLTSFMNIDYCSVKEKLASTDYLLDFTDYLSKSQGRKYAVYIVDKEQSNPLLVPLFPESKIDSLQLPRPDLYYEKPYAEYILNMLWKPIEPHVQEGATIYYVPSHILFQIALESLPLSDGSLLGEHYNFVRISSAREIGKIRNNIEFASNTQTAVLYGGLTYDISTTDMISESKLYDIPPLLVMRGDIARGDSLYTELVETKKEIEAIELYLKKSKFSVTPYSGTKGTEESFLNMNGKSPTILHIATHGFYYTSEQAETVDYLKGYKDAMSLSGLVMSGGNAAWKGIELPEGVLGGILTASNIARMDLNGTELVVLSACQTGQGEATSEGLYGLQRAFKKACAKSMIMTLWSVSDIASREFMEEFYRKLTEPKNKWNKRKAFEEAKTFIRGKYSDAYFWAAFVMLD